MDKVLETIAIDQLASVAGGIQPNIDWYEPRDFIPVFSRKSEKPTPGKVGASAAD